MVINIGRTSLPMAQHVKGKRSAVTCHLKCGNACAQGVCNESSNGYFRDIVDAQLSRRALLGFGAVGAAAIVLAPSLSGGQAAAAATGVPMAPVGGTGAFGFTPIDPVAHTVDTFAVPDGFDWTPIIRWGDPLFADSPAFDPANQTPEAQARQFGYNVDYTDVIRTSPTTAILFVNHEYTNEGIMFPAAQLASETERVRRVGLKAHGLSVVELSRSNETAPWTPIVGAPLNRRYLDDTPYSFTGPAAGGALLRTAADPAGTTPLGTFGNCSGGTTPWGTILSGEENFNGYFRSGGISASDRRYGLQDKATARGWEELDPRFDARTPGNENEVNRFGWIVEIDPTDPTSTPRKHTSLGRLKHEGANVIVAANGKVVAYTGDDERFDYLYKFVSRDAYVDGDRRHNMTLLENGDLYVARFSGDSPASEIDGSGAVPTDGGFGGTGEWLPLVVNGASAIEGMSVEEVLVYTRLAADRAGATKMDRPEDVQPHPTTGRVYVACTNNSNRGVGDNAAPDETNPRTKNRDGHIVEITEDDGDQTATTFTWTLLLVAGDPAQNPTAYFSGFPVDQVSPISCPDNLAFDSAGALWISTDGAPSTIGYNDGLFRVTLDGTDRGKVEQFLSVPREAETCGPVIHDDEWHVFVAVQHPGEDGSFEAPTSQFPDAMRPAPLAGLGGGTTSIPRPTVVQVMPTVVVTPTPTPTPSPTATPGPTSTPTPTPSPSATSTPTPGGTPAPTPSPISPSGPLATTGGGGDVGGLLAGAGALAVAGLALLARRKRENGRQSPEEPAAEA
ncbi:secreted PhoX family phosphatase [Microbacterium resistens]|uniref:Secreted PhoX family phosphatase n=1 Tax=Microbacterium resistens TaxID=156977 RepID=A0ABU1S7L8_9MICO|nr:PhoX family phosphatase [Microbacterium resistens]MDR6865609.1 secreted PhoX family phosphatase [Microbacterium resistens]